jgi:hypothetical protein
VSLEELRPFTTDLLQGVTRSHAHDLVVAVHDAVDQLVETFRLGQHDGHYLVGVAECAWVAAGELITE